MPELPEVETIRLELSTYLPLTIHAIFLSEHHRSILKGTSFTLQKNCIEKIARIGKVMFFSLSNGNFLASQLGMSGHWIISETKNELDHVHIQLHTRDKKGSNIDLSYRDPRRFGNLYFLDPKEKEAFIQNRLGVDVGSKEFTSTYLHKVIKRFPKSSLKALLLSQKYFAGIGNYMASEICARAFIRPTRKCLRITKTDCDNLILATQSVLRKAIKGGGTTFHGGYKNTAGERGEGLKELVVFYQKTCGLCRKTPIKKIILQGRGTYYCPLCQK